jgi:hypothetical protein
MILSASEKHEDFKLVTISIFGRSMKSMTSLARHQRGGFLNFSMTLQLGVRTTKKMYKQLGLMEKILLMK